MTESKAGQYLVAKAGEGKTFILGATIRRLLDMGWHKQNTISPWPIVFITKASVVLQTKEVLEKKFNIDTINECIVVGIDQLRSKFGELFLTEVTKVEAGEERIVWEWRPFIRPKLILIDEGHIAKNPGSTQHKILLSYCALPDSHVIWSSATPYTRVSESKCFCLSTKLTIPLGVLNGHKLTEKNWGQFSEDVAYPSKPDDYNQSAVDRLTDIVDSYIVRVRGVKWQFNPINTYEIIDFITEEGRKFYSSAEERFFRRKAKLDAGLIAPGASKGYLLAIMTQYNIAAESNPDRAMIIATRMYHDAQEGYSPVCTMKYKISISRIIKILMEKFGVKRSQFSVVWGGSKPKLNKKASAKKSILGNEDLMEALEKEGLSLENLGLGDDDVTIQESIDFHDELNLSTQNARQRDEEKKNFLSGKTIYCFYSIKAGGVGLSLNHSDEYTDFKCRRKESGYVYEEDIPLVPTRPRRLYGPPAYSAIDVVQFLGRCGRINSLSNTVQKLMFFRDTIEERVAQIYSIKLKCLSKVVRNRETWESVILGSSKKDREAEALKYLANTGEVYKEEDNQPIVDSGDDEE